MPESRQPLRLVFFGTAEFAVPSLESLVQAGHHVLAVVTQPDRPQGRGMRVVPSPVKQAAQRLALPVLQPRRVRAPAFIQQIRDLSPDALALAAFGQIIPQELLDIPPLGPINVHGSLLPKYRGAAPVQRALMAGEAVTGVTTMWMDASLDTGDILMAEAVPIEPEDTAGTLFPRLASVGARLLVQTLDGLATGTLTRQPQDHTQATYAPMITAEDTVVRWTETATQTVNRIRGLSPRPGVFASLRGKRVKLWGARPADPVGDHPPGTVLAVSKSPPGVLVSCGGNTALLLTEVQPESGRRMPADDWARGLRLSAGETFEQMDHSASSAIC
ncbi:MAG: methionyl-tRNA formyltransferase [Chloroherpetonaceae bacterium]|nr:methionyl-tRNA formyltransferase [Chthonomonadaceae bacterium]MDW8206637.1 methionyl-tRNA formyltransferase [Chloroherpetonaceae bacterium]